MPLCASIGEIQTILSSSTCPDRGICKVNPFGPRGPASSFFVELVGAQACRGGARSLSVGLLRLNTDRRLRNASRIGRRPLSFFSPNGLLRTLEPRLFDGGKP